MTPSEDLHHLIQSLSKSEKRFFKLYASLYSGSKDYVLLFDAISTQKRYDEDKLKRKFKTSSISRRFASIKGYLHKIVLKSLLVQYDETDIYAKVKTQLKLAKILQEKGLYKQSEKLINKVNKTAIEHELFETQLEIKNKWQYLFSSQQGYNKLKIEEIDSQHNENLKVAKQLKDFTLLRHYLKQLSVLIYQKEKLRGERTIEYLDKIINHQKVRDSSDSSFRAKVASKDLYIKYHYLLGNQNKEYQYQKELLSLIESKKALKIYSINSIITFISNFLLISLNRKDNISFLHYLSVLESLKPQTHASKEYLYFITYQNKLHYAIKMGDFEQAQQFISDIENHINHAVNLSQKEQLLFFYMFAYTYLAIGNYALAVDWINKIINSNLGISSSTFGSFSRILNLIIHFELENFGHLEYLIDSSKEYLKRKGSLYQYERLVLSFFKKVAISSISSKSFEKESIDLAKALDSLSLDKGDLEIITKFFDIKIWLKSKQQQKSIAEIIQQEQLKKLV